MNLVQLIKKAAVEAVAASNPVEVFIAEVISTSPLKIKLDQKITLDAEFLIQTPSVQTLNPGEKVLLLRIFGGTDYVVLDKVVMP